jgi:hypothetical protein
MPDRRTSQHRAHDERFTASKDRLILLLQLIVSGKRGALQPVAGELDRPGGGGRLRLHSRRRRCGFCGEVRRPDTRRVGGNCDRPCVGPLPVLSGVAGHAANISERLGWQSAFSSEPILHALGARVIGRRRRGRGYRIARAARAKIRPTSAAPAPDRTRRAATGRRRSQA